MGGPPYLAQSGSPPSHAAPPRRAAAVTPEPAARHRSPDPEQDDAEGPTSSDRSGSRTGGQSVADLMARLQAEPTGGGRRRRRDS